MILVGTSGYNYPEWKGRFYPEKMASTKMLAFYAGIFPTVEINATFYRMPTASALLGWAAQVPPSFRFTLKAPRRITHDKRFRDVADAVQLFCSASQTLGSQLGTLPFQLPPSFRQDVAVFDTFLDALPRGARAAFEFRHESWLNEEIYARLREHNLALCIADSESRSTPRIITADYAYYRLRDEGYQDADIHAWTRRVQEAQSHVQDVFVYFKHEDEGKGTVFAQRMMELLTV